jgi:hypothetical protein
MGVIAPNSRVKKLIEKNKKKKNKDKQVTDKRNCGCPGKSKKNGRH